MGESGEMYLKTILILKERIGKVRSIDIAKELDYSKPSVSRAVNILKNNKYITIEKNGFIDLTEKGNIKAQDIYEKHGYLTYLFTEVLKVTPEIAEEDACKIEHVISDESFEGLKKYIKSKNVK